MAKDFKPEGSMQSGDKALLIALAVVLLVSSAAVSVQFLKPSGVRENLDAMVQDCLGIISAAQKWYRSSSVVGGAERESWKELTFNKIGYVDGVGEDMRTLKNNNGRYILRVPPDGESFDLIAESPNGRMIIYRDVDEGVPPDPEVR